MLKIDHFVIGAASLTIGANYVSQKLGVRPNGGGGHPLMGTHNKLWRLGDTYLEVIAIDPNTASPNRPRWFGLDSDAVKTRLHAGPCLLTWVVESNNLALDIARSPCNPGPALRVTRDDLHWHLSVPEGGALNWGGAYPSLISWPDDIAPPSRSLPDTGLKVREFTLQGPSQFVKNIQTLGAAGLTTGISQSKTPHMCLSISSPSNAKLVEFTS